MGTRTSRAATVIAALVIEQPGLSTTIQDEGRMGFQRQGVPVSGALDRVALAAANIVVGNEAGSAAVEMLYQGAVLSVDAASARLAVAGGGATLEISESGETRRIQGLESVTVGRGARIRVQLSGPGIVAYMAVAGGLQVPPVMGSRSTYVRARIGGLGGDRLMAGSCIPLTEEKAPAGSDWRLPLPPFLPATLARVVPGPQDDAFAPDVMAEFFATDWQVKPASDRMGLRLAGPIIHARESHDIVSDGIAPGAIQVPGDGGPIILLADRQTTGGYVKIATVISADLPAVARLSPGMRIRFEPVTIQAAEQARRRLDAELGHWHNLRVQNTAAQLDTSLLLAANLIDGVIDAHGLSGQD